MLICDDQIRLTANERQQLAALTGGDPAGIKTKTDLAAFVKSHQSLLEDRYGRATACFARRVLYSFLPREHRRSP
jgi:hypothetical protein